MTEETVTVIGPGRAGAAIAAAGRAAGVAVAVVDAADVGTPAGSMLTAASVVVEAVDERGLRRDVLARAAALSPPGTILVTTASTDMVSELAAGVPSPERVAGLRFADPTLNRPVVEVVPALQTSGDVLDRLRALVSALGLRPVLVKDRPGSLAAAVLLPYLNQAVRELDEGLARPHDIDRAVVLGLGYPEGPLALLERIGLARHLAETEAVHAATADARYAAPALLRAAVAAGATLLPEAEA